MQSVDVTLRLPPEMQVPIPDSVDLDGVGREELLTWHVDDEDGVVAFLSVVVGDPDALRDALSDALDAMDAVHAADVTPVDDRQCYVYVEMALLPGQDAFWSAFDGRRLVVVPPVVYEDAGTVRATVLGDPDALRDVLASFPDGVEVDVERVSEHRHSTGSLAVNLTARQREAVEVARRLGYYDVPRTATLAAVADELDCSESAASTLLRKAERALVDRALGQ